MDLKARILEQYQMTDSEWEYTINCFYPDTIKAKSFFIKSGIVADRIAFLKKGLMRSFFVNDKANEVTTHFFQPGNVVISLVSSKEQKPAIESIVAVEDSELLVLPFDKMRDLFHVVPIWQKIAKDTDETKLVNLFHRTVSLQTLSAKERYVQFLNDYPAVVQKVALRHIASYLGIDNATLSRIRKKL